MEAPNPAPLVPPLVPVAAPAVEERGPVGVVVVEGASLAPVAVVAVPLVVEGVVPAGLPKRLPVLVAGCELGAVALVDAAVELVVVSAVFDAPRLPNNLF